MQVMRKSTSGTHGQSSATQNRTGSATTGTDKRPSRRLAGLGNRPPAVLLLIVLLLPAAGAVLASVVGVDGALRATAAALQAATAVSEVATGVPAQIANSETDLWIVTALVVSRLIALAVDYRSPGRADA